MTTPDHFHEELPQTDILILACPLTPETRGLMGARELAALPPGAGILNIARGGVIDHAALASSLESGICPAPYSTCSKRSRYLPILACGTSQI
jgi:phosphoglycerate dehydrogenase-like enzyme